MEYNSNAAQIRPKPMARPLSNASPNNNTPKASWMLGPMYWITPTVASLSRRAPAANSSKGTAVTTPAPISKLVCTAPPWPKALCPCHSNQTSANAASGVIRKVSSASPSSEANGAFLRSRPYRPKVAASDSAIHGSAPAL